MMDQTHTGYDYWKQSQSNVYAVSRWLTSVFGLTFLPGCRQCKRCSRRSKTLQAQCGSPSREAWVLGACGISLCLAQPLTKTCPVGLETTSTAAPRARHAEAR